MAIQNPDDLPLHERLGPEAEREAIAATNPVLVLSQPKTFKALLRGASSPRQTATAGWLARADLLGV
jgi:hypothetical protein